MNPRINHVAWPAAALFALALSACTEPEPEPDDNNTSATTNNETTDTTPMMTTDPPDMGDPVDMDEPDMPAQGGEATLTFTAKTGRNLFTAFGMGAENNWTTFLDLRVFKNNVSGESPLVIMLCGAMDPNCVEPLLVREVDSETEWEPGAIGPKPIQSGFGPVITVGGLPAGDYKLMVFIDNDRTRANGLGIDDDFRNPDTSWGGKVSELDLMMVEDNDDAMRFIPLPATTKDITLTDGGTTDLGDIFLKRIYDRDLSPERQTEAGKVVVATDKGVRIIDLSDPAFPQEFTEFGGTQFFDFAPTDAGGNAYSERVCGMIDGPDDTVFLLYGSFAVQFDIGTKQNAHASNVINFPDVAGSDLPCRGIFHEFEGNRYLYVTNASASSGNIASEKLWYANITELPNRDINGRVMTGDDDEIYKVGVNYLAAQEDTLFMSISPTSALNTDMFAPADAVERHNVFLAEIDAVSGRPLFDDEGYSYWIGSEIIDEYTRLNGETVRCVGDPDRVAFAGLSVQKFHDGSTLAFLGGCAEITVFDVDEEGQKLDFNGPGPGTPGIDTTLYGQNFASFALSPDRNTLWAVPTFKAVVPMNMSAQESADRGAPGDRHMAFPIDLTQGDLPALNMTYGVGNIDAWEGKFMEVSGLTTPADDPGIDLRHAAYHIDHLKLVPSLQGFGFQASSSPNGPTFVPTEMHLVLRGSGGVGAQGIPRSGLGKGGNLQIYRLDVRKAYLFTNDPTKEFYQYYLFGGISNKEPALFGYDLNPANDDIERTVGLAYKPVR